MNHTERIKLLAVSKIPGIGNLGLKRLLTHLTLDELFSLSKARLRRVPGIGERLIAQFKPHEFLVEAEIEYENALNNGADILFFTDKDYPDRLRHIHDAPFVLYKKGKGTLNHTRTIGVVGTRQATIYGKAVVEEIVRSAARYHCQVISGLAYGIDIAAHRQALETDCSTVAVMGSGVDIIYPAAHRSTAHQLQEQGAVISELPVGTKPDAFNFPMRNRIIAALSDALIVVEAAKKGGALITANIAHSYNKEVFAVPGNLSQPYSYGCNHLIRQMKASIYTDFEVVAEALGWNAFDRRKQQVEKYDISSFDQTTKKIIEVLTNDMDVHLDDISWKVGMPPNQVAGKLLELEMSKLVKPMPGNRYRITA